MPQSGKKSQMPLNDEMGARIVESEQEMITAGMTPEEVAAAVRRLYANRESIQLGGKPVFKQ